MGKVNSETGSGKVRQMSDEWLGQGRDWRVHEAGGSRGAEVVAALRDGGVVKYVNRVSPNGSVTQDVVDGAAKLSKVNLP